MVEIRVIDRSPGIAAADRERIFLRFQRLGDRDTGPASASDSRSPVDLPSPWAAP
jgi:signal transduction histidine kinase